MIDLIKSNVLAPISTRIGSLASGALVGIGASADHANWVGIGIASGLLIVFDLVTAYMRKRLIIDKTYVQTVETVRNGARSVPGSGLAPSPQGQRNGN